MRWRKVISSAPPPSVPSDSPPTTTSRLRIHRLDRRARRHVEVRVLLRRVRLRVQELARVLLVPDLVARDRELRQARVRAPEAAAAPIALGEHVRVGGEVGHVVRGHRRVAVARADPGPVRRVVDDRVPAHAVLRHRLGDGVVVRPVVGVVAVRRRLRLDVLPARVHAAERDAGRLHRRQLRAPARARAVEDVLHVHAVEAVGHDGAGRRRGYGSKGRRHGRCYPCSANGHGLTGPGGRASNPFNNRPWGELRSQTKTETR